MRRMTTKVVDMPAHVLSGQRGRPILQGEQTNWHYKLVPNSGLKGLWGKHSRRGISYNFKAISVVITTVHSFILERNPLQFKSLFRRNKFYRIVCKRTIQSSSIASDWPSRIVLVN